MAWFTYRCPECDHEWDERRHRNDTILNIGGLCPKGGKVCNALGVRLRYRNVPSVATTHGALRTR